MDETSGYITVWRRKVDEDVCELIEETVVMASLPDVVALSPTTLDRKRRKRRPQFSITAIDVHLQSTPSKRSSRDEEKENRKNSASPPISATKSPRKRLRTSRLDDEEDVAVVSRRRRKAEVPRKLEEMRGSAASGGQSADQLLSNYLSLPKSSSLQSTIFLCRNIRKRFVENDEDEDEEVLPSHVQDYQERIDFDLLKRLRVKALKRTGERPVFTVEFVKILDWTDILEQDFVNEFTSTSTISFAIIVVDDKNQIHKFPGGFAVVPLYKQCEENMSEMELTKLLTLKLRQFTCPQRILNSASEIYLALETKRLMSKDVEKVLGEKKRRRNVVVKTSSSPLSSDINDYVMIRRFGCSRLYKMDTKNGELACTEGVSRITLLENGYEGLELDESMGWMSDLESLQKLDAPNRKPCQGRDARLIITTFDQAVISKTKTGGARKSRTITPKKKAEKTARKSYSYTSSRNLELTEKLRNLNVGPSQCPLTGKKFGTRNDLETHFRIRFPCFDVDVERGRIEKNSRFFAAKNMDKFTDFCYRRPGTSSRVVATCARIATEDASDVEEESSQASTTSVELAPEILPCSSLRHVRRRDFEEVAVTKRATRAQSDSPKKVATVAATKKKKERKMMLRETPVPRENSRLLNQIEIMKETPSDYHNHAPLAQSFDVINFPLSAQKIREYRKKQIESMEVVRKEENRKKKKKGTKNFDFSTMPVQSEKPGKRRSKSDAEQGVELDLEGFPIPTEGFLRFDRALHNKYNMLLRKFYADFGHRQCSTSLERRSDMMTTLIENYHVQIFREKLDELYLKHIQLMFIGEKLPTYYLKPFNRFLEMKKVYHGRK